MVNKNKDLVFANFQIMAPSLKDFNNSQEFLIVSLISSLSKDYLLRKKGY